MQRLYDTGFFGETIFHLYENIWLKKSNVSVSQPSSRYFLIGVLSPRHRKRFAYRDDWVERSTP